MPKYSIPLSVPKISGNEWQYVKECLDTEWVSSAGKYVDLFEEKIAEFTGAKCAVSCVNGTSALQVSLQLAGVMPGDEVIVPTLTFIAPVNAISYNGASPVFMDSDKYYNIDIEKTIDFIQTETEIINRKSRITINKKTGKRIAAIIPVHVWGNAVWMDDLMSICAERNIVVVEDASESLGTVYNKGKYRDKHTGTVGKLGCLSFNGNKILTTGGGGMILTDDEALGEKARYLTTQAKDHPVNYVHHEIGYNFRLTNIQAALGVAQLEQLPFFLKRKRKILSHYQTGVEKIAGLIMADLPEYADNNCWMNLLQIDSKVYGENREALMFRLEKNGIQTRPLWMLNHFQRPYCDNEKYRIKKAKQLLEISLCLPGSCTLKNTSLISIIEVLKGGYR